MYLIQSGHSKPLDTTSHDHCINGKNVSTVTKPSEHVAYPTDVASQLSSFEIADEQDGPEDCLSDSDILNQTPRSCDTTTRSCDLDCNTSDTSHHDDSLSTSEMETSCEHNNTRLDDSVVVEDVEDAKGFQYQFASSNFATKVSECSLSYEFSFMCSYIVTIVTSAISYIASYGAYIAMLHAATPFINQ